MSTDPWKFKGDSWWDDSYSAMRFSLEKNDVCHPCAISQIVLNDHFKTEDSKAAAIKNYNEHLDEVRFLAVRLIEAGKHDEQGVFFITSNTFNGHLSTN